MSAAEARRGFMALALAAGAVFGLALGIRSALPLFISPLNSATGLGYATLSFAFGIQQLMWGVAQPVAGALSDRWGARYVMVAGMVDVGEQTGALPEMLAKIADNCDEEVENAASAMTSLLEPIMIVFLAVVVGSIVIAVFLPIFRIIDFGFDSGQERGVPSRGE